MRQGLRAEHTRQAMQQPGSVATGWEARLAAVSSASAVVLDDVRSRRVVVAEQPAQVAGSAIGSLCATTDELCALRRELVHCLGVR